MHRCAYTISAEQIFVSIHAINYLVQVWTTNSECPTLTEFEEFLNATFHVSSRRSVFRKSASTKSIETPQQSPAQGLSFEAEPEPEVGSGS